jgi:hypothetical protein
VTFRINHKGTRRRTKENLFKQAVRQLSFCVGEKVLLGGSRGAEVGFKGIPGVSFVCLRVPLWLIGFCFFDYNG